MDARARHACRATYMVLGRQWLEVKLQTSEDIGYNGAVCAIDDDDDVIGNDNDSFGDEYYDSGADTNAKADANADANKICLATIVHLP